MVESYCLRVLVLKNAQLMINYSWRGRGAPRSSFLARLKRSLGPAAARRRKRIGTALLRAHIARAFAPSRAQEPTRRILRAGAANRRVFSP